MNFILPSDHSGLKISDHVHLFFLLPCITNHSWLQTVSRDDLLFQNYKILKTDFYFWNPELWNLYSVPTKSSRANHLVILKQHNSCIIKEIPGLAYLSWKDFWILTNLLFSDYQLCWSFQIFIIQFILSKLKKTQLNRLSESRRTGHSWWQGNLSSVSDYSIIISWWTMCRNPL